MEKQPDIVPIQLDNQNDFDPMTHERLSTPVQKCCFSPV